MRGIVWCIDGGEQTAKVNTTSYTTKNPGFTPRILSMKTLSLSNKYRGKTQKQALNTPWERRFKNVMLKIKPLRPTSQRMTQPAHSSGFVYANT